MGANCTTKFSRTSGKIKINTYKIYFLHLLNIENVYIYDQQRCYKRVYLRCDDENNFQLY